jgi:Spy/CpxP family protein refolding chaperone
MLEHDLARVPVPAPEATPASVEDNEVLAVAAPFSSLEFSASLAEYLRLSEHQAEAIQQVVAAERRNLQPLIAQLRTTREKLLAADPERTSDKDIKALADKHTGVLAKLIVANARMHSNIYKLLTPEQQRKLEDLTRSGETQAGKPL